MDKRAAQIAGQIEAEIIRRDWPIGESLGSEQSLQQRYDVSRSVLREAIRLVEHHQVARMRRGRGGGLIVTVPDAGPATRAVVIYLEYLGTTMEELLAARLLLEPLASGLAAERIDEAGIARLRTLLGTHRPQPSADDFHVVLGDLAGNPVLALFIDVLSRLTARYAADSEIPPPGEVDAAIDRLVVDHTAIVEAVTAGDSGRAKTLTEQHVETVTALLDQHYRPKREPRRTSTTAPGAPESKRAEVLAAVVYQDIVAGGWQTGSVFGAEQELLERYGVSRPVLREAVRLLEYHTIARMRRGPGGGLIVTEPQPQASVDTIALYLEYRRPSREDLRLVRDAIEINNVATVVSRRADSDVVRFLTDQRRAAGATDDRDPGEAAGLAEYFFHTDLADLAGNRALNLFLRILVELFGRHWTSTMQPMPQVKDAEEVHRAHARILDAILDGDDSMAAHRARRHLEALSSWWL
ncbi:FadR/GntR family transcriptional regulator [Mycolicibacterium komossense]|uniref:FadR/GntR family transcriptional regulator n=1 Tax=Mycolicibacterium komossense TaxID=1779 RepID=UPI0021F2615F|nr:FCD domain-containing protein [Mycolicibacterium komossense]